MRLIVGIGALVATLIPISGCASEATEAIATSSVTATTTVGETPSPEGSVSTPNTPAVMSREEAAERYLQIVRPYNEALEELEQAVNSGQPLETLTTLADATAAANRAHVKALEGAAWPADVREPIDELIDESTRAKEYWDAAAQASSRDELIEAVLATAEHDGTDAANAIRSLLHLDTYDEDDYSD